MDSRSILIINKYYFNKIKFKPSYMSKILFKNNSRFMYFVSIKQK